MTTSLLVAKGETECLLLPEMANRHGLIAGATGTGKTVSLRVLVEQLSSAGVPTFLADVKGDLSGIAKPGGPNPKIEERVKVLGLSGFTFGAYPVTLWDVFGEQGHPIRTTVSEMGPLLLARLLQLNDTQSGVLQIVFKIADDQGLLLLDLKDLRAILQFVADNAAQFKTEYGHIAAASVGAIQRGIVALSEQGGERFFGEPALELGDLIQTQDGKGIVNILAADKLMASPIVYSTLLLWLLSELYEQLPEAGDLDKPKLVFFFDEAHLLFEDAPKVLLQKVEQIIRLVRSKGVGVYFVTQNPADIPEDVLGQLGNKFQHALRAFTPKDQKAVKAAAQCFRARPGLDIEHAITELGIGEALVSTLDAQGIPTPATRAWMYPPTSSLPPLTLGERREVMARSSVAGRYDTAVDRVSAYEKLKGRAEQSAEGEASIKDVDSGRPPSRGKRETTASDLFTTFANTAARAAGSQLGRQLLRGLMGSLLGSPKRRR
jgi:uncharacterized protein